MRLRRCNEPLCLVRAGDAPQRPEVEHDRPSSQRAQLDLARDEIPRRARPRLRVRPQHIKSKIWGDRLLVLAHRIDEATSLAGVDDAAKGGAQADRPQASLQAAAEGDQGGTGARAAGYSVSPSASPR